MTWLQLNKANVAGVVAIEGVYLTLAMEKLVAMALKNYPDFDRLVVYEADMLPPVDAFDRIASYGDEHDIVGSVYFKHTFPYGLQAYNQPDPPQFQTLPREDAMDMLNHPDLYEVGGVAMGLTAIHRRVLEDWDPEVPMWTPTPPLVGHDLHFCNEARKQGYRIWLDTALGCGHMSMRPVGLTDWEGVSDKPQFRKRCDNWLDTYTLQIAASG